MPGRLHSFAVAVLLGGSAWAGISTAHGGGVAGRAQPPLPQEDEANHPVDLASLRNHDLFDGTAAPVFRLKEALPWKPPVPLDFDPARAPDVVLLKSTDAREAPGEVTIPVGRTARTLYVLTAGQGTLAVKDIAADGEIRFADGRTQPLKWMVGEQIWPAWAGATGRNADVIPIGWNVGGDLLTASLLTVDVSWPDAPIAAITVKSRVGPLSMAVLAVTVSDAPPVTVVPVVNREAFDGYDFRVPGVLTAPLPADPAMAVVGPAVRPVIVSDGHLAFGPDPDAPAHSNPQAKLRPERARFWGINVVREGALPPKDVADAYAKSLANAGFNLVRPHHMDMDAEGSLVNPRRGEPGEPLALPEALDRMDRFHAALKAAGVYVYLETWTGRTFRPEEGVPAPRGLPVGNKYAPFFWKEYADAKKAWVRALYDRVNPYTGLRYADDPAVALVELANEDSLLVAWHGGALEKLPADHRRRLDELWNVWLRKRYKTDAALESAWKGPIRAGLQLGETLSLDSVAREPAARNRVDLYPQPRAADLARFYGELEAAHQADMSRFFRDLGFKAPIVCNTSFGVPLADAQLAACDVIDLHLYWDPISEQNVYFDQSLIERPLHGRPLEKLAWCQDDKPCTISELNHTWPNRYAHEAPVVWASLAAKQDIDAVIWFAYSHGPFNPAPDGPDGALDLAGRFSSWVQMPTASALFRGGALRSVFPRTYVRWWSPDGLLRDLAEPSSLWLEPQISWRSALDNVLRTSFAAVPPPLDVRDRAAGSPDLRWWPEAGRWVVDTDRFEAIVGRTTTPVLEEDANPESLRAVLSSFAAVSLASLDGKTLTCCEKGGSTRRALLTIAGRTERDGTLRSTGGPGTLVYGQGPARLERLTGFVDVWWDGRPEAWILDPTGAPTERVALRRLDGGWWRLATRGLSSPWVELRSR